MNMARLVSYKVQDDNRYVTFQTELPNSSENLTMTDRFRLMEVSKKKPSSSARKRNRWQRMVQCLCCVKLWQNLCPSCFCRRGRPRHTNTIVSHTPHSSMAKIIPAKSQRTFANVCFGICGCCCSVHDNELNGRSKYSEYKCEMQLNEVNTAASARYRARDPPVSVNSGGINDRINNVRITCNETPAIHSLYNSSPHSTKRNETKKPKRRYWNWNDSLRSNKDTFLETLEYDLEGERSLKRSYHNRSIKLSSYFRGTQLVVIVRIPKGLRICIYTKYFIVLSANYTNIIQTNKNNQNILFPSK